MVRRTIFKPRPSSAQKWLVLAALPAVAACAVGFWFLWLLPPADTARTAPPSVRAPEPVTQPSSASGPPAVAMVQADPFSAAAVRQRPAAPGAAPGSTDCVALMAVFEAAMTRCTAAKDSQNCVLTSVRNEGFEPATYDMCKLFRPAP
ncbi:MAG: hypothetical protein EAZ34_09415 [Polaromonas sp.]|nr:MAG: hypothetical protein EAZ34_09415 [Polaromonas sp.]